MKFIKRLIIMSGEKNKGALNLERNSLGVFVRLNAYGQDLEGCDLVLKAGAACFTKILTGSRESFSLSGIEELESVHAAIFDGGSLIMYGTNDSKRLSRVEIEGLKKHIKRPMLSLKDTRAGGEDLFTRADYMIKEEFKEDYKDERKEDYEEEFKELKPALESLGAGKTARDEYLDERLAEENYYPEPPNNNGYAEAIERGITDIVRRYGLGRYAQAEVAASKNPAKEVISPAPQSMYNKPAATAARVIEPAAKENEREAGYAMTPAYMEQIFILAGLASSFGGATEHESVIPEKPAEPEKKTEKAESAEKSEKTHNAQNTEKKEEIGRPEKLEKAERPESIGGKEEKHVKPQFKGGEQIKTDKVAAIKTDPYIKARQSTFFEQNGEEIERLFKGPREKDLEQLLPGSRWVKIDYDNSGKYYVIGLIGKEYLCYGVPAVYTPAPPEELKGYCWWLPLVASEPEGKGYWILYQSLTSGETVIPTY